MKLSLTALDAKFRSIAEPGSSRRSAIGGRTPCGAKEGAHGGTMGPPVLGWDEIPSSAPASEPLPRSS